MHLIRDGHDDGPAVLFTVGPSTAVGPARHAPADEGFADPADFAATAVEQRAR